MFADTDTLTGSVVVFSPIKLLFLCPQNGVSIMVQVALGPDAAGERVRAIIFSSQERRGACTWGDFDPLLLVMFRSPKKLF